ncbi:MAG TPA: NAD(P)-binding protein, partial [Blastocatellia bacterium]|nr:NAD(P)-binding protein [Blastocatellia bacterium]
MEALVDIAIVGAGPAGSHLAALLASSGRSVLLFDPKGAWEKPCGGGVTSRALNEYSFLLEDSSYPVKRVNRITIVSPAERRVTVKLKDPFAVYSRKVLNALLLDRAVRSGARFV